jgi:hypothetical protein
MVAGMSNSVIFLMETGCLKSGLHTTPRRSSADAVCSPRNPSPPVIKSDIADAEQPLALGSEAKRPDTALKKH